MSAARDLSREQWGRLAHDALGRTGRRPGGARRAVVAQLEREHCCVTAKEIVDRLEVGGHPVGIASVYRALEALQDLGLVQRIEVGEGGARYEAVVPGGEHHHHAVCDGCGAISAFEDDGLERAIRRLGERLGHTVSAHDVLLHGRCRRCGGDPARPAQAA